MRISWRYANGLLAALMLGATPAAAQLSCDSGSVSPSAAAANAASLRTLAWSPFGSVETGWEIYAPRVGYELGTSCGPETRRFASLLADWQRRQKLPPTGVFDAAGFGIMLARWHGARPYVALRAKGICPDPPATLATAAGAEGYLGKPVMLRPGALAAYRRLVSAARARLPAMAIDKRWLTIISGYRDPEYDAARCVLDGNCGGAARSSCSVHRTGLGMDLFVGAAQGFSPVSTDAANRVIQTRTTVYRWLVANAARFGFVNYAYEPWHWEWTGEAP